MHIQENDTAQRWVTCLAPRPQARLRLFCLPSAGGGAAQYRPWSHLLPHAIEPYAVQLPGRETRLREAPHRRLLPLAEEIGEAIAPYLDRPFAIFGHSMGALVAFELTRWLRRANGFLPVHVFVSGRRAPQIPELDSTLHHLDDTSFVREIVQRYNGIPKVILEDSELVQLFLPTLRADLEVIETYTYAEEEPLACALTAFAGITDQRVGRDELEAWRVQTRHAFAVRQFPGDHFYLQNERASLISAIVGALD